MKFKCEQCGTRYNIAESKVRNKVLKIRCKVCEHIIVLRDPAAAAADPLASVHDVSVETMGQQSAPEIEWYLAIDGAQQGPMPFERLRDMVQSGAAAPDDVVWNETIDDWLEIQSLDAFKEALAQRVQRKIPAPPLPKPPSLPKVPAPSTPAPSTPEPIFSSAPVQPEPPKPAPPKPVKEPSPIDWGEGLVDEDGGPTELINILPFDMLQAPKDDELELNFTEEPAVAVEPSLPIAQKESPPEPFSPPPAYDDEPEEEEKKRRGILFLLFGALLIGGLGVLVGYLMQEGPRPGPDVGVMVIVDAAPVDAAVPIDAASPIDAHADVAPVVDAKVKKLLKKPRKVVKKTVPKPKAGRLAGLDMQKKVPSLKVERVAVKEELPDTLTQGQIVSVIKRNQRSINSCYERQLKRDDSMRNMRTVLRFSIQPSGRTSTVRLGGRLNGTLLKGCLQNRVKRWKFPRFSGASIPVEYPLIFQASSL